MTDYDALRDGLQQAIPFNTHLGLEVAEIDEGRGVVRLPDDDNLHNHVGSQHAGGLFAAGEAASGAAFVGVFAGEMAHVTALARSAEIEYTKLASGPITATGTLSDGAELLEKLEEEDVIQFPVKVEMEDQHGNTVASMTVHWHVRRKKSE